MPDIRERWNVAFKRQAQSDKHVHERLCETPLPVCHRLHYLHNGMRLRPLSRIHHGPWTGIHLSPAHRKRIHCHGTTVRRHGCRRTSHAPRNHRSFAGFMRFRRHGDHSHVKRTRRPWTDCIHRRSFLCQEREEPAAFAQALALAKGRPEIERESVGLASVIHSPDGVQCRPKA